MCLKPSCRVTTQKQFATVAIALLTAICNSTDYWALQLRFYEDT